MRRLIDIMLLGLMTTLSLSAFAIAGSRGNDHATQPYKYIGKELDRAHGLEWYAHGARHYDPVTGRWNVMDALAEKYYPWSHDERASRADGFLVNNKEVISEFNIYITGNSNETLITGNGIKNENILRRELGKEERKEDEHPE